jgi:hypothetical protein
MSHCGPDTTTATNAIHFYSRAVCCSSFFFQRSIPEYNMKTETLSEQDGNVFFVCVCRVLLGPPPKREKKGPQNIKYLTVYTWRVVRKGGGKPTTAGIDERKKDFSTEGAAQLQECCCCSCSLMKYSPTRLFLYLFLPRFFKWNGVTPQVIIRCTTADPFVNFGWIPFVGRISFSLIVS